MTGHALVALSNVSFRYGALSTFVIRNFSYTLYAGRRVGIVGQSGTGKSTLLGLMAGVRRPSSGTVEHSREVDMRRGGRVALIHQNPALFPWRTAMANVLSTAQPGEKCERNCIDGHFRDLGLLSSVLDQYPQHLSVGMQKRVAAVRAGMTGAAILLADELLAGLDATSAELTRGWLAERFATPATAMVLVSHDLVHLTEFADEIISFRRDVEQQPQVIQNPAVDQPRDSQQAHLFRIHLAEAIGLV